MNLYLLIIKRELKIAFRNISSFLNPLLFFIIAISLFPLAISPDANVLSNIAAGIVWVAVLLAVLLSLNIMFFSDYDNAILEQMLISSKSTNLMVMAKITAHFLLTGVPIIIISPLLGILLFMDTNSIKILFITLVLTTPSLSLIGSIGAALVVGVKNSGMLLGLLVLPLYIPLLIFASSAISNAQSGLDIVGSFYFLAFILVASLLIIPFISTVALKISLE